MRTQHPAGGSMFLLPLLSMAQALQQAISQLCCQCGKSQLVELVALPMAAPAKLKLNIAFQVALSL